MKEYLSEQFTKIFGDTNGTEYFFSPGRVNMIGEHVDYNGGHVFPCALTLGTYAIARVRSDRKINLYSVNFKDTGIKELSLDHLVYDKNHAWANYPLGMVWALKEKGYEIAYGMDIIISGNIPAGSGLSSSASLEVLIGIIVKELFGFTRLKMEELAVIGQFCENKFVGMNCGIMDQFAAAMGKKDHAILLNTNDLSYEYAPLILSGEKIIITNSKVKHSLVDSKYNERRQECMDALKLLQQKKDISDLCSLDVKAFQEIEAVLTDEILLKRARHAVTENARTLEAVEALKRNDILHFGELMNESHISLKDDYEVSCKEIDLLTDIAWKIEGVIGSRMTGGGFGGCTVSIVKNDSIDEFMDTIRSSYQAKTGLEPEFYIAEISQGACRLKA